MKTKHTPGPWVAEIDQPKWNETNNGGDVWCIQIRMPHVDHRYNHANTWAKNLEKAKADACLISAAPDLLEAVKDALKELDYWNAGMDDDSAANPDTPNAIKQLVAAIAKAEGND